MARATVVTEEVELSIHATWCGHFVAVTESRLKHLKETGETFWCPYGHSAVYSDTPLKLAETRAADAERREAAAKERTDELLVLVAGQKREAARLKRRTKAGVCSHCRRTFQNVSRHMKTKHTEGLEKGA